MHIETVNFGEWEAALPASGFGWAHTPEALRVLGDHTPGSLRLYGGFKGEQPIGLCPVVEIDGPVVTAQVSPPPGFAIPQLGPIVFPASPKQRMQERVNRRFTEGLLEQLGASRRSTIVGLACHPSYTDPRPYEWADFDVSTRFTYRLSLDSVTLDQLQRSFSRETRRAIRDAESSGLRVSTGGVTDARRVYKAHERRRDEQGDDFPVKWPYIRDLVRSLGDRIRVYVGEDANGDFRSGLLVVYSNDDAYCLLGGTRSESTGSGINERLHWQAITDIVTDPVLDSIARYDFGNGNLESLAYYKSQYGATPVPRYLITSGKLMELAKSLYETIVY
ncbi:GNAT family N-acetyltransferase [Halocatena halophila]|uniref:GNAT family N-acetyltransferase n=1 Tax=Halocatena halophila TaxID=2814576 RepID=UPI002ED263D0